MKELQKINQDYEIELPQETREILKTIFHQGTAPNTLKAQRRDIQKFWRWAYVRFGIEESYPIQVSLIIQYITDHLGGMPYEIDGKLVDMGVKAKLGPHKLSTIKRRLYSLSSYRNLNGVKPNTCRDKAVLAVISKAHRAMVQNGVVVDKTVFALSSRLPSSKTFLSRHSLGVFIFSRLPHEAATFINQPSNNAPSSHHPKLKFLILTPVPGKNNSGDIFPVPEILKIDLKPRQPPF